MARHKRRPVLSRPNYTMSVIAIVGMPGSGKTTVGRHLARRLGRQFVDSDHELERELGCTVKQYFEVHGEASFRDAESAVLARLCEDAGKEANISGIVLATGGGAVLRPENRACLRAQAWVVYLRSSPVELAKRLRYDKTRPLLQGGHAGERLQNLFEQRDHLYQEAAHFSVDTGRPSVHMLVNTIAMQHEMRDLATVTPATQRSQSPL